METNNDIQIEDANHEFIKCQFYNRPHVVILGAGASRAAFPSGDPTGKVLPLIKDMVEVLKLRPLLDNYGVPSTSMNIEEIFATLKGSELETLRGLVEAEIFNYFESMKLTNETTLYDRILLSLRSKDIVASFNWDPLLLLSWQRIRQYTNGQVPQIRFLHGNVALGYCDAHTPVPLNFRKERCRKCGSELRQLKLLYPTAEKDYSADIGIKSAWADLERGIKNAKLLTIFGYSLPPSDLKARDILLSAWEGESKDRDLKQLEVIDTEPNHEILRERWSSFSRKSYVSFYPTFEGSMMARHPRRSFEYWIAENLDCIALPDRQVPRLQFATEMASWYRHLWEIEPAEER